MYCYHIGSRRFAAIGGRRENMVGVNMVLAESVKFKHGLCKSCGVEWFEGIVLEPCLLKPCFHVAAIGGRRGGGRATSPRSGSPGREVSLLLLVALFSVCKYVYTCVYVYIYTYIHTYIHTSLSLSLSLPTYIYI